MERSFRTNRGMLGRESVALEGAPHRRSATGLLGTRLFREAGVLAAILERSVDRGNQGTDRPPFDLVHHPFDQTSFLGAGRGPGQAPT